MAALGAGDLLVGVSHSCDGDWAHLPVLTSTLIDKNAPAGDIDAQVKNSSGPLYELDIARLEALAPDIVISQDLCDVCAVPSGDVDDALKSLPTAPELVTCTVSPCRYSGVFRAGRTGHRPDGGGRKPASTLGRGPDGVSRTFCGA